MPLCNINQPRLHHAVFLINYLEISENLSTATSQSNKKAWSTVDARNDARIL